MKPQSMISFALLGLLLFVGVTVAPSICAYNSNKSVVFNQRESQIDTIFNQTIQRLDEATSQNQRIKVLISTICELYFNGFIPRTINNMLLFNILIKTINGYDKTNVQTNIETKENTNCIIIGCVKRDIQDLLEPYPGYYITGHPLCLDKYGFLNDNLIFKIIAEQIGVIYLNSSMIFRVEAYDDFGDRWYICYAGGWVTTYGDNGFKQWNIPGTYKGLKGEIETVYHHNPYPRSWHYVGVIGFDGIYHVPLLNNLGKHRFIGIAEHVKLS